MPAKNTVDTLESNIDYCQKLIKTTETKLGIAELPKITEPLNLLNETVEDDVEQLVTSQD
ncbi:hypothetical protein D3C81_2145220 [compost metagenome]